MIEKNCRIYGNRAEERRKYPTTGNHKSIDIYAVLQLGFSIVKFHLGLGKITY